MKCACCGGEMQQYESVGKAISYKCKECGLTDSQIKLS
jgi:tRNA(Ile2) C34 agmatinyltransferase TiaS